MLTKIQKKIHFSISSFFYPSASAKWAFTLRFRKLVYMYNFRVQIWSLAGAGIMTKIAPLCDYLLI